VNRRALFYTAPPPDQPLPFTSLEQAVGQLHDFSREAIYICLFECPLDWADGGSRS